MSSSYNNYYSPFNILNSNIEDNDTNDEDLIEILKEIDQREDVAVLVKEVRKIIHISNNEKK